MRNEKKRELLDAIQNAQILAEEARDSECNAESKELYAAAFDALSEADSAVYAIED